MNFIKGIIEDFYMWLDDPLYHGGLFEDILIGLLCVGGLVWITLIYF